LLTDTLPHATLRLPADSSFLAVLRTATSGLAARINFTLDDIEDLRIAVDEACALLIGQAREGAALECSFWLGEATMTVQVSAPCDDPVAPSQHGFAWTVLSALTTSLRADVEGDRLVVRLSRSVGRHP
jgi:serine/threonine-protein kinase RsbW